ncbi:MAG: sugar nucleotide-binding protein, partial [Mycobacterium sp.]
SEERVVTLDRAELERVLDRFRGRFDQAPPPVSAKKIGGRPAYELARQRQPVELEPVSVEVYSLEVPGIGDFGESAPHPYEPGDDTGPLSVYGRTKLAGELAVLAALPEAVVVRTAWVYTGGAGNDFVATMRRLASGDGTVEVVDDQTGSPTYVADLVTAVLQVVDGRVKRPVKGIVHAANEGAVTRFGQARAVFEGVGADPERVRPVSSARRQRPAPRPPYSALSGRRSEQAGLSPLRPWREALTQALSAAPDV